MTLQELRYLLCLGFLLNPLIPPLTTVLATEGVVLDTKWVFSQDGRSDSQENHIHQ
jgi:hypothetical protein